MVNRLTVKQLKEICSKYSYIIVTEFDGISYGINTKCAPIALKRKKYEDDKLTSIISYKSCSFMEYISKKVKF
jgi:hypothetical protein